MIKQFNLSYRWDPIRVDLKLMLVKEYSTFPKSPGLTNTV